MKKIVNGKEVEMSEAEVADRDSFVAKELAAEPLRSWKSSMASSDGHLPRWAEDLFDLVTGVKTLEEVQELAQKVADKKELRATKPS